MTRAHLRRDDSYWSDSYWANDSHGRRVAARLRGRGSSGMSTDEIMDLLRGED